MSKVCLVLMLSFSGIVSYAAFLPALAPTRAWNSSTKLHAVASQSLDWIQSPENTQQHTDLAWIKESSMYQAIQCAQDECDDANQMLYHISSLRQLDDECLFHQAFENEPTMECSNTDDRNLVQRILELKHELHSLQQDLKVNEFANAIKDAYERELQQHWYNDYLDFYHM